MDTPAAPYADIDFGDLDFDLEPHREGLSAFARLNLEARSVKPALRARDIVLIRVPSCRFWIGITSGDPSEQEAEARRDGCTNFAILHKDTSEEAATAIRSEIERYFLRHFPGRTLRLTEETKAEAYQGDFYVSIACYPPADAAD